MNYGELKDYFLELLNRNDITDTQTDLFISLGLRRIERLLRTPMQRPSISFTVPADWDGGFGIPDDYLGFYYLKVNGIPISRISTNSAGKPYPGTPSEFYMDRGKFMFRPTLVEGDVIDFGYYQEFPQGVSAESYTNYSVVITDLVVYAALIYAADLFVDVRKADFSNSFTEFMNEVQLMADRDEMSGGVYVRNPYEGTC
jgi:hypothetical protein